MKLKREFVHTECDNYKSSCVSRIDGRRYSTFTEFICDERLLTDNVKLSLNASATKEESKCPRTN